MDSGSLAHKNLRLQVLWLHGLTKSVENSIEIADQDRHLNAWQWRESSAAQNALRFGMSTAHRSLETRFAGTTPRGRLAIDTRADAPQNLASLLRKRASGIRIHRKTGGSLRPNVVYQSQTREGPILWRYRQRAVASAPCLCNSGKRQSTLTLTDDQSCKRRKQRKQRSH